MLNGLTHLGVKMHHPCLLCKHRSQRKQSPRKGSAGGGTGAVARGPAHGCLKPQLPGWEQLVPGTVGLMFRGQAVPAPSSRAIDLELGAILGAQQKQLTLTFAVSRFRSILSSET